MSFIFALAQIWLFWKIKPAEITPLHQVEFHCTKLFPRLLKRTVTDLRAYIYGCSFLRELTGSVHTCTTLRLQIR